MTEIPPVPIAPSRRRPWDRVSLVWLIPVAAVLAAAAFAWTGFRDRGRVISIAFEDAEGVVARETELRYRDVTVGVVEGVDFTEGLDEVLVTVRLARDVAPYVDDGARFWVVSPRITTSGVSGIGTVLTGVYIEGAWDGSPGEPQDRFDGLDEPPLLAPGQEGTIIGLRATDGSLTSTVPILYKGVAVGQVGPPRVSEDGISVVAEGVVYAPYDRLLTEATRFWDASGFSLNLSGSVGVGIDFDNLTSLIVGGIAFETFVGGARPADDGDSFDVFLDEATARDSVFVDPGGPVLRLVAIFEGDVGGLARGTPVEIGGLRVGQVETLGGLIEPERFGDEALRLQAVLAIQPARLGLEGEQSPQAALDWLDARVREGLRARLATGNIITGGLEVQLVAVGEAGAATEAAIDLSTLPFPSIPTAPSEVADVTATAAGTLDRIDDLPIEELLASAIGFLDNASTLVGSPETQAVPGELNALLGDIRGVTASPAVQAFPADLSATLAEVDATLGEVRAILGQVEEQEAVGRVLAAVDRAGAAAQGVGAAAAGVPPLLARLDAVAAEVEALDLQPILAELEGAAAQARAILADPTLGALPSRASLAVDEAAGAIAEARALLADANASELGPRLAATLAAAERATASIEASVAGVPALVERLDAVGAKVEALPVEPVLTEVAALSAEARALLAQPGVQALPAQLGAASQEASATLAEARRVLSEVDAGAIAPRLAAALQAAEEAAAAVEASVAGVPGVVARIDALAATANELPFDQLVTELAALSTSANALVSAEGTQALPADLSAALAELEALLREAREGGVVQNANATLASLAAAADSLPGLVARAGAILDQASGTLAGFESTNGIVREAQTAIAEVGAAAQAVADLARAIERDPNSLIFGD